MHIRLGNILDDDRNIIIPRADRLVVARRHEPAVLVHKGDRVDGAEVLVVFLRDLACAEVVLGTVRAEQDRLCAGLPE